MRKKILLLLAGILVIGGLAACDPAPPRPECELIAVSYEYVDPNGTYSVPSTDEYKAQLTAAGWNLNYGGYGDGRWYTQSGNSQIIHGYSAEEDGHWWSCPNP